MSRPNYFLADLPGDAVLSPAIIEEACQTLKRNREKYLLPQSPARLARLLHTLGENWLQPDYPFRLQALEQGAQQTGFGGPTLARGLDAFFSQLTEENLSHLVTQDLGHGQRLETFASSAVETLARRGARVRGAELMAHFPAGKVPNPAWMSMVLGLLTRSAQFLKCDSGASWLPRLFAHSLYDLEPKLAACLEVAEWPGGTLPLEEVLLREADCVTATGSDEALAAIRHRLPPRTRFVAHGHRVSFAYVCAECLAGYGVRKLVASVVDDVVAWNQLGWLSPHVVYVERGGALSPVEFAARVAGELELRERQEPRGAVPPETSASIASRRAFYEVRAAHWPETRLWPSPGSTAWTVVHDVDPRFEFSCQHRFVHVKAVQDLTEALQGADAIRHQVSTVGLAAPFGKLEEMAGRLADWGASRICPPGRMQTPPLGGRHDGRPALADLVTFIDWEQ